ncbi:ABC transporter permease subunit [Oceanimonas sp. NS1]|nr:ABC transporter permease subunit [Oceanimonas sp. NS1]
MQQLWRVELPLALPTLVAGIRISLIISIGTATIGSTVAAKGFGEVIIAGLLTDNLAFVLQGDDGGADGHGARRPASPPGTTTDPTGRVSPHRHSGEGRSPWRVAP